MSSLFHKALSLVVELEPTVTTETTVVITPAPAPTSVSVPPGPGLPAAVTTDATGPGPDAIREARDAVLGDIKYSELTNLIKHTTSTSKLRSKVQDEDVAIATAFELLDALGVKKSDVIAEAKMASQRATVLVQEITKSVAAYADTMNAAAGQRRHQLTTDRSKLQAEITRLTANIQDMDTELASLDARTATQVATAEASLRLKTAIVSELQGSWTRVAESK